MRRCSSCGIYKELGEFHRHKTRLMGRAYVCKSCRATSCNRYKDYMNTYNTKVRCLQIVGGNNFCCAEKGCTVNDVNCLAFDHINNDGKEHREELLESGLYGRMQAGLIYKWIIREAEAGRVKKVREKLQVLCSSHNQKKALLSRLNDSLLDRFFEREVCN